MVKYSYWFFNWVYVVECLHFMECIMKVTFAIIFLVLCLWFVICLPLLELYYLESKLEGKLDKIYDMMMLFMAYTLIVVSVVVLVY